MGCVFDLLSRVTYDNLPLGYGRDSKCLILKDILTSDIIAVELPSDEWCDTMMIIHFLHLLVALNFTWDLIETFVILSEALWQFSIINRKPEQAF